MYNGYAKPNIMLRRQYLTKCYENCKECFNTLGKFGVHISMVPMVPTPFHTIHVDHLGAFVTSMKGNKYLLLIVDGFTKFTLIEPVRDTTSC
jgi:hypothetical protein